MRKIALLSLAILLAGFALNIQKVEAGETCNFTRNLEMGDVGEDVRCLQKFLNNSGFTIAASGVGSPGSETNQFKTLTKEAVIKWQKANNLNPPIGFFGPLSRTKYSSLVGGGAVLGASTNTPSSSGDLSESEVLALVNSLIPSTPSKSGSQKDAESMIERALSAVKDEDNDDKKEDARDKIFDAIVVYFKGNYSEAKIAAKEALDIVEIGEDDADDVKEKLERIDDYYRLAKDKVGDAEDDGDDVDRADDLLKDADDLIDEAKDQVDEEDYGDANDLLNDAEEKIDKALDDIGYDPDELRAKEAIKDADDAIDDAREEIDDADDNGEDIGKADKYIDDAKDALDDAEDLFDDEEWEDAIDKANEAKDFAKDAIDEL